MKKFKSLTKEQLEICPYGSPKCHICKLPPDDILAIHELKLVKKWANPQLINHLDRLYGVPIDSRGIETHFDIHVKGQLEQELQKQTGHPEIVKALAVIDEKITVNADKDLEKAYQSLVKMAYSYTKKVREMQKLISDIISQKVKSGKIQEEVTGMSALELLDKLAKLSKESREQVKDISSLRAPKVMVAQLLDNFFIEVIRSMGSILTDLCGQIKYDLTEDLKASGMLRKIDPTMFDNTFRNVAITFRDTMISVQREQRVKALSALKDLEKII